MTPPSFFKFGWLVRKASFFFFLHILLGKKPLSSTLIKRGCFEFFIVSLKKQKFCCILLLYEKVGCISVWWICTKKKETHRRKSSTLLYVQKQKRSFSVHCWCLSVFFFWWYIDDFHNSSPTHSSFGAVHLCSRWPLFTL